MAPMAISCAQSSSTASRSFRSILSVGSKFSTTGSRNSRNNPTDCPKDALKKPQIRSEEHTSELQSLMRTSYAVFCLQKKKNRINNINYNPQTYTQHSNT